MVNLITVLLAAVANMVVGFLWYSPMLFGKQWMKLMGLNHKELDKMKKKGMGKTYAISFACSLLTAYVLAFFVKLAQADSIIGGVQIGFWVWLGFVTTVQLTDVLFGSKSRGLYFLNTGYQLAGLLTMGALLGFWK